MNASCRQVYFQALLIAGFAIIVAGPAMAQTIQDLPTGLPEYYAGRTAPLSIGGPVARVAFSQSQTEQLPLVKATINNVVAQVKPRSNPAAQQATNPGPGVDRQIERRVQNIPPVRPQLVDQPRQPATQADRPDRAADNWTGRRPPVYDGLPIRPEAFRPPLMRERNERDDDEDDEDEDEDEAGELDRLLDGIDRIMGSQLVERYLKLMEENMELKTRLRILEIEAQHKLESQEMRFERMLDETRQQSREGASERQQQTNRHEAQVDELRQALSQQERELMQARSMNEQLERVADKSRQLLEEATAKHRRELEETKRNTTELEHRARALQTNLEQAQRQINEAKEVAERASARAKENKNAAGEAERPSLDAKRNAKDKPNPKEKK